MRRSKNMNFQVILKTKKFDIENKFFNYQQKYQSWYLLCFLKSNFIALFHIYFERDVSGVEEPLLIKIHIEIPCHKLWS